MSLIRSWSYALLALGLASSALTALAVGGIEATASAATPTNTPWTQNGLGMCPMTEPTITSSCLAGALTDFNRARAKESLGPMKVPANFRSLSVPMQILTLTNIDRHDRGLPVFAALAPSLNPFTQPAANAQRDPDFPSWTTQGGSNWAGTRNALWAEYMWMYDDGWSGSAATTTNGDCTGPQATGCWSHRTNILNTYDTPRVLGASVGSSGIATLMMGRDTHDWNLLSPNSPNNLHAKQLTRHRVRITWTAPAARGTVVRGYYVKHDHRAWVKVTGRSWTSGSLSTGAHTISVKSYNVRGSSPARTIHIRVK